MTIRRPCSVGLLGAALLACGPSSGDGEGTTMNGSASTGGGATGDVPTSTSAGETSAGETSAGETGESGGASGTGGAACGGDAAVCSLEHQACELVEQLGAEFEDCGTVDPWNDGVAAWQAARDCAIAAASEQRQFILITILQGFDSSVGQAYVGQAAFAYAVSTVFFDDDPCGGEGCGPVVRLAGCDALVGGPGCAVEPGEACLVCEGQTEAMQVCGPP